MVVSYIKDTSAEEDLKVVIGRYSICVYVNEMMIREKGREKEQD